ncbi:unnamed protein product [marine sediment metagenome]|uniref:DUF2225 domain-containing protein n=1 Tax=marine sediment metagenome TaxID=412755 RepID=X1B086_9ZZZZ
MTTFSQIRLVCSICEKSFKSNSIASCGFASKRTDFRPNYWGFNPVEYFVHLCPNCGFCSPKQLFDSKIENDDAIIEILEIDTVQVYDLPHKLERGVLCLEILNKFGIADRNEFELGDSWLYPYWWATSPNEERKFGEKVLKYFEVAFEKGQIPSDQFYSILYLMGEINRRIGKVEEANMYFDEVISLTENREDLENIRNLAIQQKTDPKENI